MHKIKGKTMQDEHYNFDYINSMSADVKGVFSCRGLGKTYGKLAVGLFKKAISRKRVILYLVELNEHLKELCAGDGRLFISQFYEFCEPDRLRMVNNCVYYNYQPELKDGEWGLIIELFDLASYGKAKRTKHNNIDWIIFDECIEVSNRRNTFKLSKAFTSIVESYVRNRKVEVWLFGNMENPTSEFVQLLHLQDENNKGYYYTFKRQGVSFAVHYVDAQHEYPKFWEKKMGSTSGKLSGLFDNDLNNNELVTVPQRYQCDNPKVFERIPKYSCCIKGNFYDIYFTHSDRKAFYFDKVEYPYYRRYVGYSGSDGGVYNSHFKIDLSYWDMDDMIKCKNQFTYACLLQDKIVGK